jgi:hypothetical protein
VDDEQKQARWRDQHLQMIRARGREMQESARRMRNRALVMRAESETAQARVAARAAARRRRP